MPERKIEHAAATLVSIMVIGLFLPGERLPIPNERIVQLSAAL
jgi:hypothetical protein